MNRSVIIHIEPNLRVESLETFCLELRSFIGFSVQRLTFMIETGTIKINIAHSTIYTGYNSAIGNNQ